MARQRRVNYLVSAIEEALDLGEFVSYKEAWDFIRNLENVKEKIDGLLKKGQAKRYVPLYEMFLSGCYEKADEIDDSSGNLGITFKELFYSWIKARQKARYADAETIYNIIKWMDNDQTIPPCFDVNLSS